ncbi:MAG: glycoside hydrolase family 31 protein [Terracidiphilus sp.]|nr:glycoside hydrolase family 31 protein [Terracidiphilus sp.]
MQVTRRTIAKSLMAGAAAGWPRLLQGENKQNAAAGETVAARRQNLLWQPVMAGIWRARLGTPETFSPVAARLVAPCLDALSLLPRVEQPPLDEIRGTVTRRGSLVELPLRSGEQVYGFGLQMLSFQQRGKKKTLRVNADPKCDTGDSHAPVPFYVTSEGVGVFIDTARYATFYVGDARRRPEGAAAARSDNSPDPAYWSNLQEHESGTVTVEIPLAQGVDIYLFAGPEMLDAVRRYNLFAGGGPQLPDWGLGFWYRVDARSTADSTLALAREFRERSIPCDVLGLEPGWQTHAYSCTFEWNRQRFPKPDEFLRKTKALGYKINLWEHAYTHPASPLYPALRSKSGTYGVWGGLVPDFADADARAVFGDYHGRQLIDKGVNGFKLDECDNSDFTGGWCFPEASQFPSGLDGEQMHSIFGLGYQMAIWHEFRKRNLETCGLVRSSGSLATPFPFVLYSDLYNHRDFIRTLVNSSFSGLLWCPEVRDARNEEELIRRLQSVVFSPLAMVNGWYIKNPPWKQLDRELNNADKLIEDWPRIEARCREIVGWRMQLIPYLRSAFARYRKDGTPPFRALVLDAPSDRRLQSVDDQYMIGDRMMVAPLFAGEPGRKVVFPGGDWHDFWTGERLSGGRTVNVAASSERIPVYVKSGSLVPWANVGLHAASPEARRVTVRVYGDGALGWSLNDADETLHLAWHEGKGRETGKSRYAIQNWQRIG